MPGRRYRCALAAILSVQLGACTITHDVELFYPPAPDQATLVAGETASDETKHISLYVFDARTDKTFVGRQGGKVAMRRVEFETTNDVEQWVYEAFARELAAAGYRLGRRGTAAASNATHALTVDIQKMDADMGAFGGSYNAEMLAQVTFEPAGGGVPRVTAYDGVGSGGAYAGVAPISGERMGRAFANALREIIRQTLADLPNEGQ